MEPSQQSLDNKTMQTSKINAFLAASALALGLCSATANAQPQPPHTQPSHGQAPRGEQQHQTQQRDNRQSPPPAAQHRVAPKPAFSNQPQIHARGAGPEQRWQQGSKMPSQYRGNQYVVNDWQHHGLKKPGRGQQWVQYGGDYLLVAIASGVIAQVILGR